VNLTEYFKKTKRDFPPKGTVGVESDWLDVGAEVEVTTGSLWAGDPFVCNAKDGCVVKVPKGTYVLQAKAMDFAGRKRVSRLRVVLQGAGKPGLGKKGGDTVTDTARMGVCDIVALHEAIAGDFDDFNDRITQFNYKMDCGVARFEMKAPIAIPYVANGFGDCDAPVYELKSRSKSKKGRIGIELEFLAPGYAFSFGDEDED